MYLVVTITEDLKSCLFALWNVCDNGSDFAFQAMGHYVTLAIHYKVQLGFYHYHPIVT